MNEATCRGCGAPVVWIRTSGGKSMPCDSSPICYKAVTGGKDKIVTIRGEVVRGIVVNGAGTANVGYRPHWVTCPLANRFRRRGQPADDIQPCSGQSMKEIYKQIDIFDMLKED